MKSLLFTLMLAMGATAAQAQDYKYVTLQQANGVEKSLAIDGLVFTFSEGKLVAKNTAETATFDLSALSKFFFAEKSTSAIESVLKDAPQIDVAIRDGKLQLTAPEGSQVRVYSMDGRQVPATQQLTKGAYIVSVNGKSFKVLAQ